MKQEMGKTGPEIVVQIANAVSQTLAWSEPLNAFSYALPMMDTVVLLIAKASQTMQGSKNNDIPFLCAAINTVSELLGTHGVHVPEDLLQDMETQ